MKKILNQVKSTKIVIHLISIPSSSPAAPPLPTPQNPSKSIKAQPLPFPLFGSETTHHLTTIPNSPLIYPNNSLFPLYSLEFVGFTCCGEARHLSRVIHSPAACSYICQLITITSYFDAQFGPSSSKIPVRLGLLQGTRLLCNLTQCG